MADLFVIGELSSQAGHFVPVIPREIYCFDSRWTVSQQLRTQAFWRGNWISSFLRLPKGSTLATPTFNKSFFKTLNARKDRT